MIVAALSESSRPIAGAVSPRARPLRISLLAVAQPHRRRLVAALAHAGHHGRLHPRGEHRLAARDARDRVGDLVERGVLLDDPERARLDQPVRVIVLQAARDEQRADGQAALR